MTQGTPPESFQGKLKGNEAIQLVVDKLITSQHIPSKRIQLREHDLIRICDGVVQIFKQEPALLTVPVPCFIVGDLHGQVSRLFFESFS